MNYFNMLLDPLQADWIEASFPIIRICLLSLMAVCAIVLIITTLLQDGSAGESKALTGVQESYYSQNKWNNKDGRLKKLTIIMASIIAVAILLFFISTMIDPIA